MCCIPGESLIAVFIDFENLAMGAQVTKSGREFHGQGIGLVDIPQSRMSGKNSADIHVVVDAIDLCYSKDHIDTFALLSGDSDFSLLRLRNCAEGRRVAYLAAVALRARVARVPRLRRRGASR